MSTLSADAEIEGHEDTGRGSSPASGGDSDDDDNDDDDDDDDDEEEEPAMEDEDEDDHSPGPESRVFDQSEFVPMKFAIFLQEEGQDTLSVAGHPDWTLVDVREACAGEMDGRGLWVFMHEEAPVDPEEEIEMKAVDSLNDEEEEESEEEEEVDEMDGFSDDEIREKLAEALAREKRLKDEVSATPATHGLSFRAPRRALTAVRPSLADERCCDTAFHHLVTAFHRGTTLLRSQVASA